MEVTTLEELEEALAAAAEIVMLDNMTPAQAKKAIELVAGRALVEISGDVTLDNVRAYAECGPDFISVGKLTHSAPAMNFSLEFSEVMPFDLDCLRAELRVACEVRYCEQTDSTIRDAWRWLKAGRARRRRRDRRTGSAPGRGGGAARGVRPPAGCVSRCSRDRTWKSRVPAAWGWPWRSPPRKPWKS